MRRSKGSRRLGLSLAAAALLSVGVVACGGSEDEEPPAEGSQPATGKVDVPEISQAEKSRAKQIAIADPTILAIAGEQTPKVSGAGIWTRSNQEVLGAVVELAFEPPIDFTEAELPSITNLEDLYGNLGEGDPGPIEPNVEPEVGEQTVSGKGVTRMLVNVDLETGQVVQVVPMGGDVEFD